MDVLAATGDGLYRISDDGTSRQLAPGAMLHVVATDEGSVALDATGTLWSIDDDGAAEFDELGIDSPTCLLLDGDDIWIGTAADRLVRVHGPDIVPVTAFDDVEGRDEWYTPWGGPAAVRSLDIDDDGVLYVAVHVGGIIVSRDAGESWEPSGFDLHDDVHQVCTVPDYAKTVVAGCGHGLGISTDDGETWELVTSGLPHPYCRAVAIAGDTVLVSASQGPGGEQSALYRMPLDGERLTPCEAGLPDWFTGNIDTHCLAAWDEVVVVGTGDGTVYLSDDSGGHWKSLATDLPPITALALP